MVPGEAHLVVATSSALDGHVELVPYSLVRFLKENLRKAKTGEDRRKSQGETPTAGFSCIYPGISSVDRFLCPLIPEKLSLLCYVKVANGDISVCSLDTADEGAETEEKQPGCRS